MQVERRVEEQSDHSNWKLKSIKYLMKLYFIHESKVAINEICNQADRFCFISEMFSLYLRVYSRDHPVDCSHRYETLKDLSIMNQIIELKLSLVSESISQIVNFCHFVS